MGLLDLLQAFRQVVERIDKVKLYEIVGEDITIEERLNFVLKEISEKKKMKFTDLFANETRKLMMVVTFFALLELIRLPQMELVVTGESSRIEAEVNGRSLLVHSSGPANAAIGHMRDWALGTQGRWVTMGVASRGPT